MNHEIPDVQVVFRKGRGTRDQIANIYWIFEKAREFQNNINFCFISQIWKEVRQDCILSPCLYAEYILRNTRLNEAQAGIKITGRNINNLTYADDTTLMAESKEELKSLLMKMKEESEKFGLKLNIQKSKIMASGPITSRQIDGEPVETVSDFILGSSKITADDECSYKIKRHLLLGRKVMTNRDSI